MKRKIRAIIAAVLAAAMCAAFTGCGKSDLEKELENAANQLDKEFGNTSKPSNTNNTNNTSNTGNNAASSTPELEKIDPFADIKVTFTGISPNSKINISGGNSNVTYTPSSNSGMRNGDEIEITAELRTSSLQNRYSLTQTSKKFTVSGLSSYASKLDEISKEFMDKMNRQAEDVITANTAGWAEGNTMKSLKNIGYYMLSAKEGFNPSTSNYLYCVYKVTANFEKGYTLEEYNRNPNSPNNTGGEDFYYTYVAFSNIMILEDGTCTVDISAGRLCNNTVQSVIGSMSWGSFSGYGFQGYKDLDSMFNAVVAKQLESYSFENTVKDIADTAPSTSSDNSEASAADSSESSN